jgi:NAD(P)-dependent dehydrogenase (short-subunit alcohol dehydrogenase family)
MAKLPSLLPQLLLLSGPAGLLLWYWLKRNRPDASAVSTKGLPGASVYSATKAAVRSFARTWTIELAQRGIRVNALSPGPVDTPIYTKLGMTPEQVQGSVSKFRKPHRPVASASQKKMATVAIFLASSDSSFMYGADLAADGRFAQVQSSRGMDAVHSEHSRSTF